MLQQPSTRGLWCSVERGLASLIRFSCPASICVATKRAWDRQAQAFQAYIMRNSIQSQQEKEPCVYIYSCYIIYIYIITYTLNLLSRNVRTNKLRISVRKFSYVQSRPEMWIFQLAMFKTRCSSSLALCSRCLRTGSSVHG